MRFAICQPNALNAAARDILEQNRLRWLKFGEEYFCYSADAASPIARRGFAETGIDLKELETSGAETAEDKKGAVFLVAQEGRLFQRAYPDARVLYDKGRYLVVLLDPVDAARIQPHDARFAIRPIAENQVVFEVAPPPAAAPAIDARVKGIVDRLNRSAYASTLAELASYPTRHSLSSHFQDAAKRARDRLQMMGYEARLQEVAIPGGTTVNVVADKPGSAGSKRSAVLVTAHLDSVNHAPGPTQPDDLTAPAPGADDNASGSAGILEIARAFKDEPIEQDLRLILFGGEEQGLLGSRHYVSQLPAAERARIAAVLNMDMIGVVNTATPTVLLEGKDPLSVAIVSGLSDAARAYTGLSILTSFHFFDSDHVPFIEADIPAVLTIEGNDSANENIHTATDTLDRINYDLALEILRMNTAYVARQVGTQASS